MKIAEIIKVDYANGEGTRLSVFVSGCNNNCKGCFNTKAKDFNYGKKYDKEMEDYIIKELSKPYYHGITILGGEPFEKDNQMGVFELIFRIKTDLPNKDIWMYTGYMYEDLLWFGKHRHGAITDYIMDSIDVLVDGPFMIDKKRLGLKFKGSENQRIIDMKKTREYIGRITLKEL